MTFTKAADANRPAIEYRTRTKEFIVFGRKPMFGHQGKAVELFRTKSRESAHAKLAAIEEEAERLTEQRLIPVITVYGAIGVKDQNWRYIIAVIHPDKPEGPPSLVSGTYFESDGKLLLKKLARDNKERTFKLFLTATGRELGSATIGTTNNPEEPAQ